MPVNDKFFISANIPYQDLKRTINNATENLKGNGDGNVVLCYELQLYKKQKEATDFDMKRETSGHSLLFGMGANLPGY